MSKTSYTAKEALQDLFRLSDNGFYSIAKLEWWLLKYDKLYLKLVDEYDFNVVDNSYKYQVRRKDYTHEIIFINNYWYMDWLSIFRRFEPKMKRALEEYDSIKHDHDKTQNWVEKYYLIWDIYYFDFLTKPYWENYVNDELQLYLQDLNGDAKWEYLYKKDFKYTVEFIDLYWEIWFDSDLGKKENEAFEKEQEEMNKRKDTIPKIVDSIKSLNFEELESLLDPITTYDLKEMTKSRFVELLKKTMHSEMYCQIKTFDKVEEYTNRCARCTGGVVYRFIYQNKLSLELCFDISLTYYIIDIRQRHCKYEIDKQSEIEKIELSFL
jgi:hypothetical protein